MVQTSSTSHHFLVHNSIKTRNEEMRNGKKNEEMEPLEDAPRMASLGYDL